MNRGNSIDWLRFTQEYGKENLDEYLPNTKGGTLKDCRPMRPYSQAKSNKWFSVHWDDNHPEWRVMVEMNGQQLSDYRKSGNDEMRLFKFIAYVGAKVTRVDFAVDLFDSGGNPTDFYHAFHTSQVMTVAKSVSIVERTRKQESMGATVYIGSRSSERMVRVYDKGKQSKTKLDWLRVELEIKGTRAEQFAELVSLNDVERAGLSYLADVIEWSDIEWFEAIWTNEYKHINIDTIGRPETSRERWLRDVVIPAIADEVQSGSVWVLEALEAILEDVAQSGKHGPKLTIPHK